MMDSIGKISNSPKRNNEYETYGTEEEIHQVENDNNYKKYSERSQFSNRNGYSVDLSSAKTNINSRGGYNVYRENNYEEDNQEPEYYKREIDRKRDVYSRTPEVLYGRSQRRFEREKEEMCSEHEPPQKYQIEYPQEQRHHLNPVELVILNKYHLIRKNKLLSSK
jgi:hypothetical protein